MTLLYIGWSLSVSVGAGCFSLACIEVTERIQRAPQASVHARLDLCLLPCTPQQHEFPLFSTDMRTGEATICTSGEEPSPRADCQCYGLRLLCLETCEKQVFAVCAMALVTATGATHRSLGVPLVLFEFLGSACMLFNF